MPEPAIVCQECRISNPAGLKKCVRCGTTLQVNSPVSTPVKLAQADISPPTRVYRPYPSPPPYRILPGRPPWITAYALLLGLSAVASLVAMRWRLLDGSLISTYNNFFIVILLLASNIVALWAASELRRMRRTGLVLTLLLQAVWIIAAIALVYNAFISFPTSWRHEFFINPKQATLEAAGVIVMSILLILFAPIWIPAIFGVMRIRGGFSTRFEGIFITIIAIAFVSGFLLMFIALPVMIFQPSLMKMIDPQSLVPGLLRLGFTASIPINLLIVSGLLLEQQRFK